MVTQAEREKLSKGHQAAFIGDLTPVIVCELTASGWRGLTEDGEVLNVNGGKAPGDGLTMVDLEGRTVGFRTIAKPTSDGTIDAHLLHFYNAGMAFRQTSFATALAEIDKALRAAPTTRARFNRAMMLLSLGRWQEGFQEYADCETKPPFMRPICRTLVAMGVAPWKRENLRGKHLLLVHAHGFGDTIMMLRFVPKLEKMGAKVSIMVPPPLERLAAQVAPVVHDPPPDTDFFIAALQLMDALQITPERIPARPYLKVDPFAVENWRARLANGISGSSARSRDRIGLAWSVGKFIESDYPRPAPLKLMVDRLRDEAELISVQTQDHQAAQALGVRTFNFEDFADCAACMSALDEIVTVDTAALHLAGAIGHPRVTALLSHWHSWRWLAPWYEGATVLRQERAGDWESVFVQRAK